MYEIINWLELNLGIQPEDQNRLLASLVTILVLWLLYRLALVLFIYRIEDQQFRYQWRKTTNYIFVVIGFLIVGRIWFVGFQSLATFLGLLSAGLAIALKDPIANFFGWVFILWRHPFEVGDRIELAGVAGDVIDIRIFQFTLMEVGNWVHADQSTGRILHVPNGLIFTATLANYTKGSDYIWNELPILVTFESNWQKAKGLLQQIVDTHNNEQYPELEKSFQEASRQFLIRYGKLTPIVYTSIEASGVLLTIRYLCKPRQRRSSAQEILEDILRAFAIHSDIEFAYPTQRFFTLSTEGKRTKFSIISTEEGTENNL